MGVKPGMRVLEVGCATGFVTSYLSNLVSGDGFVVSIDVQEKMIKKAKRKRGFLKNTDFRTESATDIKSVKDEEIDLVLLYFSFHEISGKEDAVREFYRVLKPKGILSIREPREEVLKKNRNAYWEYIEKHGFKPAFEAENCDAISCCLKFIKD